jgi:hypothetical protein
MPLNRLFTILPLAIFAMLYLHHLALTPVHDIFGSWVGIRSTTEQANKCVHLARSLYIRQLQHINLSTRDLQHDDATTAAINDLRETFHKTVSLNSPTDLSDCAPIFHPIRVQMPPAEPPYLNWEWGKTDEAYEADKAQLKAAVAAFKLYMAPATVSRCFHSINQTLQRHEHLDEIDEVIRNASKQLADGGSWHIKDIESFSIADLFDDIELRQEISKQQSILRDRAKWLMAHVDDVSDCLEPLRWDNFGMQKLLADTNQVIVDHGSENATAAATEIGSFEKDMQPLMKLCYTFRYALVKVLSYMY